ncbi:hypothetical protein JW835_07225 [bacterium]|nr:hypothetical protein [bacterium]
MKSYFSRYCDDRYKQAPNDSRKRKREQTILQRRFWEHLISDEKNYQKHIEYIHYNPVKHGLVYAPYRWKYSSFHKYVQNGIYEHDWASHEKVSFDQSIGME